MTTTKLTTTENGRDAVPLSWASAPVDVYESENDYLVFADLPGAAREDVDIQYHEGQLRVEATRAGLPESWPARYRRVFNVGAGIDVEGITATLEHGVLSVTLPKSAAAKPKQIEVS
jgi:HSP20 family molecular chaperone IbpA